MDGGSKFVGADFGFSNVPTKFGSEQKPANLVSATSLAATGRAGWDAHFGKGGDGEVAFWARDGLVLVFFACGAVCCVRAWLWGWNFVVDRREANFSGSGMEVGAGMGFAGSPSVAAAFCTCEMLIVGLLPFFLTSSSGP